MMAWAYHRGACICIYHHDGVHMHIPPRRRAYMEHGPMAPYMEYGPMAPYMEHGPMVPYMEHGPMAPWRRRLSYIHTMARYVYEIRSSDGYTPMDTYHRGAGRRAATAEGRSGAIEATSSGRIRPAAICALREGDLPSAPAGPATVFLDLDIDSAGECGPAAGA